MFSPETFKKLTFNLLLLALLSTAFAYEVKANKAVRQKSNAYGVIKGVIINDRGAPLATAVISIFRAGTAKILKQVKSAADGSFLTRVVPGTYTILARAEGYDSVALNDVQVNRSAEVYYGLRMERVGQGRTFAEKKIDRDSPKWRIRAAQSQRSIYQAGEGDDATVAAVENRSGTVEERTGMTPEEEGSRGKLRGQSLVETYAAGTAGGDPYIGLNFATAQPLGENIKVIFAGQTGTSRSAPNRFETTLETRVGGNHQLRLTASAAKLGSFTPAKQGEDKELGQLSFQATDQWQVREGFILVYGFDYARLVGAGNDAALSPRFGAQYDLDAKTRLGASYTGGSEERTWQSVIEMEGDPILFRTAMVSEKVAEVADRPVINKNRRFEIGIERVLDNNSSFEAAAFFDTYSGRGIGLVGLPMGFLSGGDENSLVQTVNQTGKAQGVRIAYNRRFGKMFSAGAGYAFGRGQKLSPGALSDPQALFANELFQTFIAQITTDLRNGTKVKAVYRLSPQATVFAIDPFAGKMAIYDPSVSILIVQSLPTWGLPFRAEAVIDARNLLDYAIQAQSEEGAVKLNSGRRGIRGGISVRF
jgi:hypothetical protein